MNEVDKALTYIFAISLVLVLVAYFAGTQRVISSGASALVNLINAATGRDVTGAFAAYPSGGPTPM
jgi:hypothetical protein